MPLTISLTKGMVLNIGDLKVTVSKVFSSSDFSILVNGRIYDVNEDYWVTIAEGVQVRAPIAKQVLGVTGVKPRIQIEAPNFVVTRDRN